MEFGRAAAPDRQLLTKEHFLLQVPEQAALSGQPVLQPKTYIGLPKWGRKEWTGEGKLYPPKTKESEFLDHYVQHFNSIELNATHYKIHPKAHIEKWAGKAAGKDFLFCPKFYQGITHRGSLKGKSLLTREFYDSISGFGGHLGPLLVQVADSFSTKRMQELFEFLEEQEAPGTTSFLELRHPSWFAEKNSFEQLQEKLRSIGAGLVITDTVNRRDAVHMMLTVPKTFVRFGWLGNKPVDEFRIRQWKQVLDQWFAAGLESCFFFLHVSDENETIGFAKFVQEQLGHK